MLTSILDVFWAGPLWGEKISLSPSVSSPIVGGTQAAEAPRPIGSFNDYYYTPATTSELRPFDILVWCARLSKILEITGPAALSAILILNNHMAHRSILTYTPDDIAVC